MTYESIIAMKIFFESKLLVRELIGKRLKVTRKTKIKYAMRSHEHPAKCMQQVIKVAKYKDNNTDLHTL